MNGELWKVLAILMFFALSGSGCTLAHTSPAGVTSITMTPADAAALYKMAMTRAVNPQRTYTTSTGVVIRIR